MQVAHSSATFNPRDFSGDARRAGPVLCRPYGSDVQGWMRRTWRDCLKSVLVVIYWGLDQPR